MTFARRPETSGNQERREAFREQAAAPDVTVLHCRIPSGAAPAPAAPGGGRGFQRDRHGD